MAAAAAAAAAFEALDEHILRSHIRFAAAGRRNLTTEQVVDILCSAFPEEYSIADREKLTERVAKITPPPRRSGDADADATGEPTPVANKRRRTVELGNGSVSWKNRPMFRDIPELVAKITPPPRRSGDADATRESTPVADRRRRTDELGNGNVSWKNRPMFRDLLGMDTVIKKLKMEVIVPLHEWRQQLLRHLGVDPTARILLHGPPGCGKTTLARAIANEAGLPLFEIPAARLVSGVSAEENIRELFSTACMRAPSVVFIDELDALTSKTGSLLKEIEPRILNQLMACLDEPCGVINHDAGYMLVIGATNSPDALDPTLRQRFDCEFALHVPQYHKRLDILAALTSNLKVEVGIDLGRIALCTLGYVAGDLVALAKNAGILAANRYMHERILEFDGVGAQLEGCSMHPFQNDELEHVSVTMSDFVEAAKKVRPSSRLSGFSATPNAKWDDVGGLQLLKLEFERHIFKRIKFPEVYKDLGVDLTTSFFLYGPSGCGKTLIVEALANEAGANFLHIKGPKLLRYGYECELVVQIIFNYARAHPPCIVFLDQLEAIIPGGGEGRSPDFEKLIFMQLDELYYAEHSGVYVIGATNSPDVVNHLASSYGEDGYFGKDLCVPLPSPEERGAILKALARNKPIDADVDFMALGKHIFCENFSGADLSNLMKKAADAAIDRPALSCGDHNMPWTIKREDFNKALPKISPYVSSTELMSWKLLVGREREREESATKE